MGVWCDMSNSQEQGAIFLADEGPVLDRVVTQLLHTLTGSLSTSLAEDIKTAVLTNRFLITNKRSVHANQ